MTANDEAGILRAPPPELPAHGRASPIARQVVPFHPSRESRLTYWTEFKNTILPWLLAGGVVMFLVNEHRQTTQALLGANARLAEAVEEQGKALEGVRQLLSAQGYTLPPLNAPQ